MSIRPPARQELAAQRLQRLCGNPPLCLVLEAGTEAERQDTALYWAALLNCGSGAACGQCPACVQIAQGAFRDLLVMDGRQGSIKVDDVRDLRALMGEAPGNVRVLLLQEAQALTTEAANCLLKAMEEPRPGNVFVLTTPQRERLLPTLVSRSFVVTLAWPATLEHEDPEAEAMAVAMLGCWAGGSWFGGRAGKVDARQAEAALTHCRRLLGRLRAGLQTAPGLPPQNAARLDAACEQALEALGYRVNPGLVLDWLAAFGRTLVAEERRPA